MLDINTPLGQQTLQDELRAAEIFEARYPQYTYVHTDKTTKASIDAVLAKKANTAGLVLTCCRYDCTRETFRGVWGNEWVLTWRKLMIGAWLAKHFQTRLLGFVYIVNDDLLLVQKLYDPRREPAWLAEYRVETVMARATLNDLRKIPKRMAYIKLDGGVTEIQGQKP